jgi:integrase
LTAVLLMATTGLRRGEVCGLTWTDVDMAKGEIRVRHTLSRVGGDLVLDTVKTDRSRRRVPLHAGVVEALRLWRQQQAEERAVAGDQWTDTEMVFCTQFGTAVDPRNLLRTVELAGKKAGVGRWEPTPCGTALRSHGWSPASTSKRPPTCWPLLHQHHWDLYGHTSDDTARAAVDGLGTVLGL